MLRLKYDDATQDLPPKVKVKKPAAYPMFMGYLMNLKMKKAGIATGRSLLHG